MKGKGLILTGIFLSVAAAAFGQSYQGGVRGSVTDSSGGVVPNTKVVLLDEATKVSRAVLTNGEGAFVFNALEPATYTITAEAPGFKKLERAGIIVGTQEFLTVDLKLQPGSVVASVMVTGEVPSIKNSTPSNCQVLYRQNMTDLTILD